MRQTRRVPRLAVDTVELLALARGLRTLCAEARLLQRSVEAMPPAVTGDAGLSAALEHHAAAWSWSLEVLDDRLRDTADRLETGAEAYAAVEGCLGLP